MNNNSNESKVTEAFASLMIEKIKSMQVDWKKPWIMPGFTGMPQNISGREYNGINSLMLMMLREKAGYQTPVFMTFQQAKQNGWDVKKGEKGFPVELWRQVIKDKDNKKISFEDFKNLSEDEQALCKRYPLVKTYIVFNVEQTRLPELEPEKWQQMLDRYAPTQLRSEDGMLRSPELDFMLDKQTWVCPINLQLSDSAFYSPGKDHIVLPLKSQFETGEFFYGTMLHEMAHSTGHKDRLNRIEGTEYGREELVAEMSAAMMASQLGITKGIQEDNVAYLQGWLKNIHEKPEFLKTVMADVNKACEMIQRMVMSPDMAEQMKNEAISSIDRFIDEKQSEKQEKVPVLSREQLKELSPSIKEANVQQFDIVSQPIENAWAKCKKNAPDVTAWVMDGSIVYILGDDAKKIAEALKLKTTQMIHQNGEVTDTLTFTKDNLSLYLPQVVRKGIRVVVSETEKLQVKKEIPVVDENAPKLHMACLGSGITAWEEGDNEYTAHISENRNLKMHKDFHPVNQEKLERMANEGNLVIGNNGTEYLALQPLNMASRFIYKPYGHDPIFLSSETIGEQQAICHGQTVIQRADKETAEKAFKEYTLLQKPEQFIVSITGIEKMRDSLTLLQRAGIDTSALHQEMFFDALSTAEEMLSPLQKQFKKICFKVENRGSWEKPEWAISRFSNHEQCEKDLNPDKRLPIYYLKGNCLLYNQPAQQEIRDGLSINRMVLSQNCLVRVKGRDNLPDAMRTLANHGISFTGQAGEMVENEYEHGLIMPRGRADRDYIYFEVKNGIVNDILMNINEALYDDEPILEVNGKHIQKATMYNAEENKPYLICGYDNDGEVFTFTKIQNNANNLKEAETTLSNLMRIGNEKGNQINAIIKEWKIIQVNPELRDTIEYQMMDVTALKHLMDEHPHCFSVHNVYAAHEQNQFTNHKNETTMAKKEKEQVMEPEVKQEAAETQQEQQATEKQLREGTHIFQRKDKTGNLVPGVYGVMVVKDGVKSEVATISKEDRDQYFKDVKGKNGEEAEAIRKALAEKYITPDGKRIGNQTEAKPEAEKPNRDYFVLHHAAPEKAARISEPKVFKKDNQYRIRCIIDGEQQISRAVSDAKTAAFFKDYKGMSPEDQLQRRTDLAAVVFNDVLRGEKQEQSRGIGR